MIARRISPILNVSDIAESFAWFAKLGWEKAWDWGSPPTFGAVRSGGFEVFLCQGAQGGRGRSEFASTEGEGRGADKGVWMSIWVDDVDAVRRQCLEHGLEITRAPADEPWGLRELHVRHPDGHVFRFGQEIEGGH